MMEHFLSYIVPTAYAEPPATSSAPAADQGSGASLFLMFAIFFVFIYFAIWRPQNKRAKEQKALITSLAKGDEVMTAGGILGRLTKITDQYITLTIANNVEIVMQKSAIVSVLPKGTLKSIE